MLLLHSLQSLQFKNKIKKKFHQCLYIKKEIVQSQNIIETIEMRDTIAFDRDPCVHLYVPWS